MRLPARCHGSCPCRAAMSTPIPGEVQPQGWMGIGTLDGNHQLRDMAEARLFGTITISESNSRAPRSLSSLNLQFPCTPRQHDGVCMKAALNEQRIAERDWPCSKKARNSKQTSRGCIVLGRDGEKKRSEEGESRIAPPVPGSSRRVQVGCRTERACADRPTSPTPFMQLCSTPYSALATCTGVMGLTLAYTLGGLQLEKLCKRALLTRFPRTTELLYRENRLGFKFACRGPPSCVESWVKAGHRCRRLSLHAHAPGRDCQGDCRRPLKLVQTRQLSARTLHLVLLFAVPLTGSCAAACFGCGLGWQRPWSRRSHPPQAPSWWLPAFSLL